MAPHKLSAVITPFSVAFTQTVHGGYSCDQGAPRGPGEGTLWRLSKAHMPSLWGAPWHPQAVGGGLLEPEFSWA